MTADYSEYKARYDRDGFVVIRNLVPAEEMERLRREVGRFLRDVSPTLLENQVSFSVAADGTRVPRQIHRMNVDSFFEAYRHDARMNALASALVGEPVAPNPPVWLNKPAGTDHPTPPHQDNIAFCLAPPNAVQIFLALEPIDRENGCLRYLAGSHLGGPRPHYYSGVRGFPVEIVDYGPEEEAAEVTVELQPGDVSCHHPETVHRAMPNRSRSRSREALAVTYVGASARIDPDAMSEFKRHAHRGNREGR